MMRSGLNGAFHDSHSLRMAAFSSAFFLSRAAELVSASSGRHANSASSRKYFVAMIRITREVSNIADEVSSVELRKASPAKAVTLAHFKKKRRWPPREITPAWDPCRTISLIYYTIPAPERSAPID